MNALDLFISKHSTALFVVAHLFTAVIGISLIALFNQETRSGTPASGVFLTAAVAAYVSLITTLSVSLKRSDAVNALR